MKKDKTIRINEARLHEIIKTAVNEALVEHGLLVEYALPLKEYRAKVDALSAQIVQNWCLCKCCRLFDPQSRNFNHWKGELFGHIHTLSSSKLKNNDSKAPTTLTILKDTLNLDDRFAVMHVCAPKFRKEVFADYQMGASAEAFGMELEKIAALTDMTNAEITQYIEETFKIEL